jgi:hypothetical protein
MCGTAPNERRCQRGLAKPPTRIQSQQQQVQVPKPDVPDGSDSTQFVKYMQHGPHASNNLAETTTRADIPGPASHRQPIPHLKP